MPNLNIQTRLDMNILQIMEIVRFSIYVNTVSDLPPRRNKMITFGQKRTKIFIQTDPNYYLIKANAPDFSRIFASASRIAARSNDSFRKVISLVIGL